MEKICLIGDSIRMGYQGIVDNDLKGYCEVIYDGADNGRFVQYELWQLNQLIKNRGPFKIVFFNSGYWDMNVEPPMNEPFNPIPIYLEGLKRIVEITRDSKGIPIFINSLPIYDAGTSKDNTGTGASITYKNEWVTTFNKAAEDLMHELKVEVIDLYHLIIQGYQYYKCPDMLHLTFEGYTVCAHEIEKVAKRIIG